MVTITVAEFKDYFDRGQFSYGADLPSIRDKDIESAIAEAEAIFNHDLYDDEAIEKQALLYLTAHFLQSDVDAGGSEGQPSYTQQSRSADGVSESVIVPEWMQEGVYSFYSTTYYGQKFIMLSKPYMDGAVYSVPGGTSF